MAFTAEQILALAPDASSVSAGRGLANLRKWVTLGANETALWGECQGSGSKPYQTQIALAEPAFKCSCPSRKFPCKHGLGLFLLHAAQPDAFKTNEPPEWVAQWLEGRTARAEKATEKAATAAVKQADPAAQQKRASQREQKVNAGIQELELWIADLIRSGLGQAASQPYKFWSGISARMVDAQAPGLARRLRELSGLASTGHGWQDKALAELGKIQLLIEAFRRLDSLPKHLQDEVRTQIGWTIKEEELQSEPGITDEWLVIGQRVEEEESLRIGRSWLYGRETGKYALVLQFAHQTQNLQLSVIPGTALRAELIYYPGAIPLRAAIRTREHFHVLTEPHLQAVIDSPQPAPHALFVAALAQNPWLETWPTMLTNVLPATDGERWSVQSETGDQWLLDMATANPWFLAAASGGHPIHLFGEWNGQKLRPFGALTKEGYVRL